MRLCCVRAQQPTGEVMDAYVVQVYRREPEAQALTGRVEHVTSGRSFASAEELWEFLISVPKARGSGKRKEEAERKRSTKPNRLRREAR